MREKLLKILITTNVLPRPRFLIFTRLSFRRIFRSIFSVIIFVGNFKSASKILQHRRRAEVMVRHSVSYDWKRKLGFKIGVKISEVAQVSYQSSSMIQSQLNIDSAYCDDHAKMSLSLI